MVTPICFRSTRTILQPPCYGSACYIFTKHEYTNHFSLVSKDIRLELRGKAVVLMGHSDGPTNLNGFGEDPKMQTYCGLLHAMNVTEQFRIMLIYIMEWSEDIWCENAVHFGDETKICIDLFCCTRVQTTYFFFFLKASWSNKQQSLDKYVRQGQKGWLFSAAEMKGVPQRFHPTSGPDIRTHLVDFGYIHTVFYICVNHEIVQHNICVIMCVYFILITQ